MDASAKLRKVDIQPIGVLGFLLEKSGILYYLRIGCVFERVRKAGLLKRLVTLLRKIDLEKTAWLNGVIGITSN